MNEQFWWFVARSSGMVAAVLIGVTVVWGLLLSTRIVVRKGLPAWLTERAPQAGWSVQSIATGLEDVFISLTQHAQDNFG